MMAYLELDNGPQAGKRIELGNTFSLGRNPDNDLVLSQEWVSRYHARISRQGERYLLEDLASSNGTLLRHKRLPSGLPTELVQGDEIEIGTIRLIFHLYRFLNSASVTSPAGGWSPNPPR